MSSAKRRQIVKLKKGVQDKLRNIQEQREILNAIIEHYVSEVTAEAESLLSVSDPTQFMQDYMGVMLNLDKCYNGFEIIIAETENLAEKDDTTAEEDDISKDNEDCVELNRNNTTTLKLPTQLADKSVKPVCDNADEGIGSKTVSSDPSLSGDVPVSTEPDVTKPASLETEPCVKETVVSGVGMRDDANICTNKKKPPSVNESDSFDKPFTDKHLINITEEEGSEKRAKHLATGLNADSSKANLSAPEDFKDDNTSNTRKSTEKSNWSLKDAQPRVDVEVARRFLTRILNTNEQHNKETIKTKTPNTCQKTESKEKEKPADNAETKTKTKANAEETEAGVGKQKYDHVDNEMRKKDLSQENVHSVEDTGELKTDTEVLCQTKETKLPYEGKTGVIQVDNESLDLGSTRSLSEISSGGSRAPGLMDGYGGYGLGPKLRAVDLPERSISVVEVTEPGSPWKFYIQMCGTDLNKLMEDICHFMIQKLAKNIEKPVEGMSCLAKFSKDNVFYRAKVTNVYSPGKDKMMSVDVVFVDYGNGERRKCTDLRELPVEFSVLPTQAISCAVAKVAPANKYGLWTEGDILYFRQFVSNQQFNCIPVFHSKDPDFPHLIDLFLNFPMPAVKGGQVFMQPSFTQVSVLALLVNQGCAKKIEVGEQLQLLGMPEDKIKSPFKKPASEDGNSRSKTPASDDGSSRPKTPASEDGYSRSKTPSYEDGISRSKAPASKDVHSRSKSDEENMNYSNNRYRDIDTKNYSGKKIKNENVKQIPRNTNKKQNKSPKKEIPPQADNNNMMRETHLDNVKKEQRRESQSEMSISSEPSHESNLQMSASKSSESDYNPRGSSLSVDNMNTNQNNLNTNSQRNINNINSNITEKRESVEETVIEKVQNMSTSVDNKSNRTSAIVSDDQVSSLSTESETVSLPMDLSFGGQSEELSYLYNQGHKVMLSHIESPDSFYVHVGTESTGRTLDKMMKSLNKTFEQKSKKKLLKLSKSFQPVVNELCCAQFSVDNCFYRVLITEVKHYSPDNSSSPSKEDINIESCHAFYVDFGNQEWVKKKMLFPLPEEYSNVPPLAIHCSLAYIRPSIQHKDNLDNVPLPVNGWSAEATDAFCTLTDFEKLYDMLIVSGNLNKVRVPEKDSDPLKVLLVDNTDSEEICVNMDLIHAGVAMIDTSHINQVVESPTSPEVMLNWDPMMEDYLSIRNSYKVDVDDAGVATVGYKAQDEKRICKYYANNTCWRGERCPYRHVQTSSDYITLDREPVFGGCIDHQEELLPDAGSWVAMEIATIMNPGHFYVILPWGNKSIDILSKEKASEDGQENSQEEHEETLEDLLHSMSEHYSTKNFSDRDLLHLAPGELVASRFSMDGQWYRAKVLDTDEDRVQVFYVDFGNREWVPEKTIRQMEPEFLHLPFQAIESFLLDIEPIGQQWSKEARQTFRELVDGKTLVAHVKERSWNGCLWMEIFDTTGPEDISVAKALIEKGLAQEPSVHADVNVVRTRKPSNTSDNSFIFVPG